ncbi:MULTISPECIES: Rne/Rng family ribonuclease [Rhodobacterales]|uniref:Rne/Rng family ribonuclease n=1 Tax=Rhodobacterales TaxID=204455 RepID=UPI00237F46B8|nr:ribonuclease E/G [Phaeobacter gallaeciensis]MDE4139153.1 Rne/Rng family ribonuclease [Phaeobacter gallaeciensis]MDE4147789.1 Rne/Rng family ribonuclease [Phaeobacter gallaeciensis]MDE4152007.1 Rne/Rng family ribonuclease [Phaeobacter gallaeciensis]MDE4227209.1 Rne/Rng family ribonuclease [Phaeobacter gallaeciensis]MDE4256471.1 Rne/Rng family ribonuclease [Phaeobacter gallaeciensis]
MAKKMLIDATHAEETRVVVVDGNKVEEFDFESENKRQLAGNIYLAKVTRVEPSLQAAFVDYGGNRHGFLAFSEIHPDYYQIPVADREALMEEERAYAEAMRARDEEEESKPSRGSRSRSRKSSRTKAAKANAGDAVETKEVTPQDNADDASTQAPEKDSPKKAEIAGMETIDLDAEDGAADDKLAEVPEGTSPMETVAETPVEEPDGDDQNGAEATSTEEAAGDDATADAETAEDAGADNGDVADKAESAEQDVADDKDEDDKEDTAKSDATSKDETIESVADEDDSEDIRPPRKPRPRRYKIQEVIKVRQVLLVQVVKEERGNKGAALTTYLSLAGRYCVLMPNTARGGGISRKITNAADRKKLKDIATELDVPQGAGLIVRTAGAKRTKAEIKRDYEYLQRLWEQIRELTLKSIAPAKIYEEGDLIKRSIRDLYNREIDEVLVEGERGYRIAKDFMKMIMPSHAKNVKNYNETLPLFARYQVESYLAGMFNPTVQLKSGGYIVIGVTEALVAIDVNSGRATKEASIEETALKTNLEAAEEVARQLRLRDLAGLIVIDFIDMDERKNNAAVEKRMKDKLKTDRARIQVGRISGFGLMEMSRQRLRPGMIEATTAPCPHCHGTGLIRSDDSLALSILRQIEEEGTRRRSREVLVKCPVAIANYLMNQKREHIAQIEARYGLSVRIEGHPHLVSPDFELEKFKTASRTVPVAASPVVSVDTSIMDQIDADESEAAEAEETTSVDEGNKTQPEAEGDGENKPKRKRRRRRRRKSGSSDQDNGENNGDQSEGDKDQSAGVAEGDKSTEDGSAQDAKSDQPADAAEAKAEGAEEGAEQEEKKPAKRTRRTRTSQSRSRKKSSDKPAEAAEAETADAVTEEKPAEPDQAESPASQPEEAVAAEAPAEAAAEAEAAPDAAEAAPAEEPEAVEPAEATAAAEPEAAPEVEPAAEEAAAETAPAEAETAAPEEAEKPAEPEATAPETAGPETKEPEVAVAAAEPAPAPEPEAPPKPKRRGWWSLGS